MTIDLERLDVRAKNELAVTSITHEGYFERAEVILEQNGCRCVQTSGAEKKAGEQLTTQGGQITDVFFFFFFLQGS